MMIAADKVHLHVWSCYFLRQQMMKGWCCNSFIYSVDCEENRARLNGGAQGKQKSREQVVLDESAVVAGGLPSLTGNIVVAFNPGIWILSTGLWFAEWWHVKVVIPDQRSLVSQQTLWREVRATLWPASVRVWARWHWSSKQFSGDFEVLVSSMQLFKAHERVLQVAVQLGQKHLKMMFNLHFLRL